MIVRIVIVLLVFALSLVGFVVATPFLAKNLSLEDLLPVGVASDITSQGYSLESVYYLKEHDLYTSLGWLFLVVAASASVTLIIFGQTVGKFEKVVLICAPLSIAIPISAVNYAHGDAFSTRSMQAIINLPIIFLSAVAALNLSKLTFKSEQAAVARQVILALVVMQGICIPAIYSLLWWLNFQNAISRSATKDLAPGWISAVSGLIAICFSIYKHFEDVKTKKKGDGTAREWQPFRPRR